MKPVCSFVSEYKNTEKKLVRKDNLNTKIKCSSFYF